MPAPQPELGPFHFAGISSGSGKPLHTFPSGGQFIEPVLEQTAAQARDPRRARAFFAAILCNTLEWYDFAVYGILATHISAAFFPQEDRSAALLAALAVFGVSFVVRPIGGLILGGMGDRRGRKPALLISAGMMAAGALTIALLPPYATIGILAPVLLLAARLVQGFSAGGEWGVANAFLLEWSPEGKRGFWTSFMSVTVAFGSGLASAMAAILSAVLDAEAMADWGWRVPFLFGGLLGFAALWARIGIEETPVYREADHAATPPENPKANIRLVIGFVIHWTVCYYIFLIYLPLYTKTHAGISAAQSAWSNAISTLVIMCVAPMVGALSDRFGRKPFLLASTIAVILLTLPLFWVITVMPSFALVVAVQMVFGLAIALYSGSAPAVSVELYPARVRSRWSSMSYALAVAIFGGFAPFIAVWLTGALNSPLAPAAYVIAASIVSLLVIRQMPETAHRSISG